MFRRAGIVSCVLAVAAGAAAVAAQAVQTPPAGPSKILAPGAQVEKVAGDFIFTEGATSDDEGNVYFVDQDNNRIMKYDISGKLSTYMQPSGYANGPPDSAFRGLRGHTPTAHGLSSSTRTELPCGSCTHLRRPNLS